MLTLEYVMANGLDFKNEVKEIRINCPECDDNKAHCYCNTTKMLYHCFKCGASGKIVDTAEIQLSDMKYKGLIIQWDKPTIPIKEKVRNLPHSSDFHYNKFGYGDIDNNQAWQYLKKRGFTIQELVKYNIRVSLEKSGPYKNTIIFPVYEDKPDEPKSILRYFVCRRYTDEEPKYVNAPWPKENTLYDCVNDGDKNIKHKYVPQVIVEGIFDAMAISRAGYWGIALLGKRASSQQLLALKERSNKYIIYLDEDAFTHAIHLKLQFQAIGIQSEIITHRKDAAQLAIDDMNELKEMLNGAVNRTKQYS